MLISYSLFEALYDSHFAQTALFNLEVSDLTRLSLFFLEHKNFIRPSGLHYLPIETKSLIICSTPTVKGGNMNYLGDNRYTSLHEIIVRTPFLLVVGVISRIEKHESSSVVWNIVHLYVPNYLQTPR